VGCGGLGSNTADFLSRLGIGKLTLIDHDLVEITNLHRTALFFEEDIGKSKAEIISKHVTLINSHVKTSVFKKSLSKDNAEDILGSCDIILDGTDNLDTRYLINEVAIKRKIPWIYAGVHSTHGMVLAIIPNKTPCLSCLSDTLPQNPMDEIPVLGTLPASIAALQISEALKVLFELQTSGFILFNLWSVELEILSIQKNPDCSICRYHRYTKLSR
jgi:adenylyltransferase/sulfurtransferase